MTPLVSVCMPVYNGEKHIKLALDSLLEQSYYNIEIIISDNGSTDLTSVICNQYSKKNSCITHYRKENTVSVSENFLSVLSYATGKYVMFAAHDDFWDKDFISENVNKLEKNSKAVLSMCATQRNTTNSDLIDVIRYVDKDRPDKQPKSQLIKSLYTKKKACSKGVLKNNLYVYGLYCTEQLKKIFLCKNFYPYQERYLLILMALLGEFEYVDKTLFYKTVHEKTYKQRNNTDVEFLNKNKLWGSPKLLIIMFKFVIGSGVYSFNQKIFAIPVILNLFTYHFFDRFIYRKLFINTILSLTTKAFRDSIKKIFKKIHLLG